ncbi:bacteriocin fulvocin C-related protein [Nocardiopsis algeriensis]|uniref:Bacteriocin fulvocin C-related protein n=1 Tax=Nocardiopsis algeriensis TaxID=1478215 RepID=A0A841IVQ5_9ACTN|nr:bacteriocin fulvocin C-related protein [Nocardiopsis algeriensis]MBB6122252.1 hypothetical protein [Nocardiopsis algeriensis]
MSSHYISRWVLAFDASCERCRAVSAVVEDACADRIELLPLLHPEVERWRRDALGEHAPWAPTLIRVGEGPTRAWTGPMLGMRLLARLGPASTLRLVSALSSLRAPRSAGPAAVDRKGFLRLGTGLGVAVGLVLAGRTPALAESAEANEIQTWVKANRGRLPDRLDTFGSHPMAYRRAIFAELSPQARSRLWVEHLGRYRREHPNLTGAQREVLERAEELAAEPALFSEVRTGPDAELDDLTRSAIAAYGEQEAHALLATLGPPESAVMSENSVMAAKENCTCSIHSDWCRGTSWCRLSGCKYNLGCGTLFLSVCNGHCYTP